MQKEVALRESLKYRLRLLGHSFSSIAAELKINTGAVSNCCSGVIKSKRIQSAIAAKLGEDPATIWPSRYDTNPNQLQLENQQKEVQNVKVSGVP
ncbi:MAG: helix-turn-helix domain-containing protein [Roseobacter sp.]